MECFRRAGITSILFKKTRRKSRNKMKINSKQREKKTNSSDSKVSSNEQNSKLQSLMIKTNKQTKNFFPFFIIISFYLKTKIRINLIKWKKKRRNFLLLQTLLQTLLVFVHFSSLNCLFFVASHQGIGISSFIMIIKKKREQYYSRNQWLCE